MFYLHCIFSECCSPGADDEVLWCNNRMSQPDLYSHSKGCKYVTVLAYHSGLRVGLHVRDRAVLVGYSNGLLHDHLVEHCGVSLDYVVMTYSTYI